MDEQRWLVVGLGNPGPRYAATRHNAGALVVQLLAERSAGGSTGRFGRRSSGGFKAHAATRCEIVETRLAGVGVVLAKPMSYMNESGGPISSAARYFKIPIERVAVVHDELDLPFGTLRLKRGGGEGGHNGLRSTSASLGSVEYARVRVGIGRPPGRQEAVDYVLREFNGAERKELPFVLDRAGDAVEALVAHGLEAAQNEFNG